MIATFLIQFQKYPIHQKYKDLVPELFNIGLSSKGFNPWVSLTVNDEYVTQCTFNLNDIDRQEQLDKLEDSFFIREPERVIILANIADRENESIMSDVCVRNHTNCAWGRNCIFFNSTNPFAVKCRAWFRAKDRLEQDFLLKSYCSRNESADDCQCINRINNKQYRMVKQNYPFYDKCWYIPCVDSNQLQLSEMIEQPARACPRNVCQIIYDLHSNRSVLLRENTNNIICDFHGLVDRDGGGGGDWVSVVTLGLSLLFIVKMIVDVVY